MRDDDRPYTQEDIERIAVIGMAGRFPGAKNIDEFWLNIRSGVESVIQFTDDELKSYGVPADWLKASNFVKAGTILDDVDKFDASFFGYSPKEATRIDPQQRIFLEMAWKALENAGYTPDSCDGSIGVFAGCSPNDYVSQLPGIFDFSDVVGQMELMIGNQTDNLATRVSYKLNLNGPSITVQTACSTSLVAVHLACQSLLSYQSTLALAGGASVKLRKSKGYFYHEGTIVSPDGHCRAFDANAQGTVIGQGVGVVALKRLSEAIKDGDNIYCVIRGSAVNNDGGSKIGYTAPSVEGQAEVIAMAHALSDTPAETIGYVEAHGTGTNLGDPIEIAALTKAFRSNTIKSQFCGIGSVKTNIGHADIAAGIAGLIKTALMLRHKEMPPSLNFQKPNPEIDFANSPFYVNTEFAVWHVESMPRRAGVSSFGIGGTNTHMVLEEAPSVESFGKSRSKQLLLLSAKTPEALETKTANLVDHFKHHPEINLADAAYTLNVGRMAFDFRRMIICADTDEAISTMAAEDPQRMPIEYRKKRDPSVAFMFSGQGTQYVNMGLELYQSEPVFKQAIDQCAENLKPHIELDLRKIIYPVNPDATEAAGQLLSQTRITQPALFTVEYALAQLWMTWGVRPAAMVGHSIGEYVAACLAGVFTLEDALKLVAARGRLMQELPEGSMLAVSLSEAEIQPYLNDRLGVAVISSPSLCVVSGEKEAVNTVENKLSQKDVVCRPLHSSHAFHSQMMDAILTEFNEHVKQVRCNPPKIPFVSNLTGRWIRSNEATDPGYWARHLRQAVRLGDCLNELLKEPRRVFLEVGPGNSLSTVVRQQPNKSTDQLVVTSVHHPKQQTSDVAFILNSLGRLWLDGVQVDWSGFYTDERHQRIPLPSYPFERHRFWTAAEKQAENVHLSPVSEPLTAGSLPRHKNNISDWFYVPSWKRSIVPSFQSKASLQSSAWLVFIDECGLGARLVESLEQKVKHVISVKVGKEFARLSDSQYVLNPQQDQDYVALVDDLEAFNKLPETIVHLWNVTRNEQQRAGSMLDRLDESQSLGIFSLLALAQAIGKLPSANNFRIEVVSNNVHEVTGEELLNPEKATILGPCKVIPLEYTNISCRNIDISLRNFEPHHDSNPINQFLAEMNSDSPDGVVAYRGHHRWVPSFEPVRMDDTCEGSVRLRTAGVYMIVGGLGGIALELAENLAKTVQAKLILTGRSEFPARSDWTRWLDSHDADNDTSLKIRKLQAVEDSGGEVFVLRADLTDLNQMQEILASSLARFGRIDGVIHNAGVIDQAGMIQRRSRDMTESGLDSKVRGTLVLDKVLQDTQLDFLCLFSSIASELYHNRFGQVSYVAANSFLDAYAYYKTAKDRSFTVTINWEDWQGVGMSAQARKLFAETFGGQQLGDPLDKFSPAEGITAFRRILSHRFPRVAISTRDLGIRLKNDAFVSSPFLEAASNVDIAKQRHPRPNLSNQFVAPGNELENTIAGIWQELLGVESVGIHDDYFELGGDSLMAAKFISRLRETFKVEMPLQTIFEAPTINGMADKVDTLLWARQPSIKSDGASSGITLVEGEL